MLPLISGTVLELSITHSYAQRNIVKIKYLLYVERIRKTICKNFTNINKMYACIYTHKYIFYKIRY